MTVIEHRHTVEIVIMHMVKMHCVGAGMTVSQCIFWLNCIMHNALKFLGPPPPFMYFQYQQT